MKPKKLNQIFDTVAEAPGGIERLRELVLQLAVQGKLVPQDAGDEPATTLLAQISTDERHITKPQSPVKDADAPWRLPNTWTWVRLKQIVNFTMGKTPPTKDASYWTEETGGYPWLSIADMDHFRVVSATKRYVTTKAASEVFGYRPVPSGTILMSFKLTIGKIARLGVDAYHNEAIISLYPIVDEMDAYLFQFMPLFASGGSSRGAIKGKTLNTKSLANILVALPPLTEQLRIVAKVNELMLLIDRLEATRRSREDVRIAARESALTALRDASKSEEVGQSWSRIADWTDDLFTEPADLASLRETILHLAVRGRLVRQNEGDEPVNSVLDRIANCNTKHVQARNNGKNLRMPDLDESISMNELPIGWAWVRTEVIGVLNQRNKADDDTMVSFCPMSRIPTDHRKRVTFETRRWGDIRKGYTHFADGDVVVAKITPCFQNRKSCVMSGLEGGIGAGTTELYVVRVNPQIVLPGYLLLFYKSPGFLKNGVAVMTGTAGQQRVPREYLEHSLLPIPPLAEQHRIIAEVDELMGLIDRLENHVFSKIKYQETAAAAVVHPV